MLLFVCSCFGRRASGFDFGLRALGIGLRASSFGLGGPGRTRLPMECPPGPWSMKHSGFGLWASDVGLWASAFGLGASGFGLGAPGFGLWLGAGGKLEQHNRDRAVGFGLGAPGFGLWPWIVFVWKTCRNSPEICWRLATIWSHAVYIGHFLLYHFSQEIDMSVTFVRFSAIYK